MKIVKEFNTFAVKGSMVDIAIGVIIGSSLNTVANTFVKKILLPPLYAVWNGIELKKRKFEIMEGVFIGYGEFLEVFFNFLIVAVLLFSVIRFINRIKSRAQDVNDTRVETPKDIELLSQIKDLLEKQNKK